MGIQLVHGHRNYANYIMLYDLCTHFVYIKYIYICNRQCLWTARFNPLLCRGQKQNFKMTLKYVLLERERQVPYIQNHEKISYLLHAN